MKRCLPLMLCVSAVAFQSAALAADAEVQDAINEAIKKYPPGDYGPGHQLPPSPAVGAAVEEASSSRSEADQRMLEKLRAIRVAPLIFNDTPALSAFEQLMAEIGKDVNGHGIGLAFALDMLTGPPDSIALDRRITLSVADISAQEALDYMVRGLALRYDLRDGVIIIRQIR
jgi:hypothetical protein